MSRIAWRIEPTNNSWAIVHAPTGLYLAVGIRSRADARRILKVAQREVRDPWTITACNVLERTAPSFRSWIGLCMREGRYVDAWLDAVPA